MRYGYFFKGSFYLKKRIHRKYLKNRDKNIIYRRNLRKNEVLKVKLTEDSDITKVQQGQLISVQVNIANVKGNLYYSQSGPMKFPRDK